jgi:glycosyltransferase involved in cell wall biosynthesis
MAQRDPQSVDVSVIIPFHDAAPYLERCLDAVHAQMLDAAGYEVILVDNGSTRDWEELVEKFPRVRIFKQPTPGAYAARNRGVRESNGQVLAFIDSDCVASKNWLKEVTAPLKEPGACLVQGARVLGRKSLVMQTIASYDNERAAYSLSLPGSGTHFGYTNNMAVRRQVFDRCGPFDEVMRGADSIFVDRVVAAYSAAALRFAPKAEICHLELTRLRHWLSKKIIYGRSFQLTRKSRKLYRKLRWQERRMILDRVVTKNAYSPLQCAMLYAIAYLGASCFAFGRASAAVPVAHRTASEATLPSIAGQHVKQTANDPTTND